MGGEGSMSQANQSLKYNRGQLGRRSFRENQNFPSSQTAKTTIKFDKVDPEVLEKIKLEIRVKARKEKKKTVIIFFISVIITAVFFLLIFL